MIGSIIAVLHFYQFLLIIRAVQSWIDTDERHPTFRALAAITDPVLRPVRAFTTFGSLDLSPVVVIVVIQLIIRALHGVA